MIFKVKDHKKYNAEHYFTKHKEKRKESKLFCPLQCMSQVSSFVITGASGLRAVQAGLQRFLGRPQNGGANG